MNSLQNRNGANVASKPRFATFLADPKIKKLVSDTLQDPKRINNYVASISGAIAINPGLQECDFFTILTSSLLGESLNLSPSPQLGHYYMVPFNDKSRGKVATFQLGYKGFLQLAMRSGQYKKINVLAIKEGELRHIDYLSEEVDINFIEDEELRENTPTIGYYAMFEYLNGFKKMMYWSKKKMQAHAKKYSQGYASDLKNNTNWTFWSKDFDGMAFKTMLRQLISKWGIMSIELQKAFEQDMSFTTEKESTVYFDNDPSVVPAETIIETPVERVSQPVYDPYNPAREITDEEEKKQYKKTAKRSIVEPETVEQVEPQQVKFDGMF